MPKRFIVWDKRINDFVKEPHTTNIKIFSLIDLKYFLKSRWEINGELDIELIQSTNLFDKDGKEIFEGSIVRRAWEVAGDGDDAPLFLVVWSPTRAEFAFKYGIFHNGAEQIIDKKALKDVVVIGHILSNPELLEEK